MANNISLEKIHDIIKIKRQNDPVGFQRAQGQGPTAFAQYLAADVRKIGIDPTKVPWEQFFAYSFIPNGKDTEKTIYKISDLLDEVAYDPIFNSTATSFEQSTLTLLTDMKRFTYLNRQLRILKVVCAGAGLLCTGAFLGSFLSHKLVPMIIYGIATADLLRISYNCYIKNYICLSMSKLGGNMKKAGDTFIQWLSNAAGLVDKDPFSIVQNEVSYEILTSHTWSKALYMKAMEWFKDSKKYK